MALNITRTASKDVRAHCYCTSLVRTLYMTWRVETQQNIELMLICEYFCWMLGDPHFLFGRSLPFLILSIKKCVRGKFLLFLIYYSKRVELVHGYSCARLISCLF